MNTKSIMAALALNFALFAGSAYATDQLHTDRDPAVAPASEGYSVLAGLPADALSDGEMSEVQGAYLLCSICYSSTSTFTTSWFSTSDSLKIGTWPTPE